MAIKMRHNKNANSVCCECGEKQDKVLEMLDVCVGENIFTICDKCNEQLLSKCLSAECQKNARVKSQQDMEIIKKRANKRRLK